jgi:O-antigen/teichoic acid export membrane protein
MLLREFVRQFSFAHLHVWTAVILDAAVAALQLGTLLLLGCFHRLSPVTIYATMGGACAIAAAGWFLSTRHPMQLTRARALADWWHNWAFGKWALAGQLIGSAATYLLPWILVSACGEAETGMLAACATLIGVANMFVTGMGNFLVPRTAGAFAAGGVGALGRVLGKAGALYTAFFALFGVLVLAAGEQLTVLIYGAKYSGVGPILGLLALAMFADALGRVAGNGLWAMERPSANFLADVCSLFVLIVSAVCLIRPLGVIGVAIVQLSATLTGTAVRGVTLLRLAQSLRIEAAGGNA